MKEHLKVVLASCTVTALILLMIYPISKYVEILVYSDTVAKHVSQQISTVKYHRSVGIKKVTCPSDWNGYMRDVDISNMLSGKQYLCHYEMLPQKINFN